MRAPDDRSASGRVSAGRSSAGSDTPEISVIIPVHSRREFLDCAVASALNQTLERSRYEVIVIAWDLPAAQVSQLEEQSVIVLTSHEAGLGGKLAEGIEVARSDLLTFLEDDDQFESNKLVEVLERFQSDPALVYYHNSFRPIDQFGSRVTGSYFRSSSTRQIRRKSSLKLNANGRGRALLQLTGLFAGYNNSCISIRRRLITRRLDILRATELSVDELLFLIALGSNWNLLVDATSLTRIRFHPGSVSNPSQTIDQSERERLIRYSKTVVAERERMILNPTLVSSNQVQRIANGGLSVQRIIALLRGGEKSRSRMAQGLIDLLRYQDTFEARSFRGLIPFGLAYFWAPSIGSHLYWEFRGPGH
jgi:glycosyltransferase involved in cell wall biosynthesis